MMSSVTRKGMTFRGKDHRVVSFTSFPPRYVLLLQYVDLNTASKGVAYICI